MQELLQNITSSLAYIKPEIFLSTAVITILIVFLLSQNVRQYHLSTALIIITIYGAMVFNQLLISPTGGLFNGMIRIDEEIVFYKLLTVVSTFFILIYMILKERKRYRFEFSIILLSAILGASFMMMSTHFLMLYTSLELLSICSYILVYLSKGKSHQEASLKYIIYGIVSSGLMIYGVSVLYLFIGSLSYQELVDYFISIQEWPSFIHVGILFTLVGLLFKIGAVPFHIWIPDTYQGMSFGVASFLAVIPKISGIIGLFYLLQGPFQLVPYMPLLIIGLSVLTMMISSVAALWQKDVLRLLGYSSILNTGFLLLGLTPAYLLMYQQEVSFSFYLMAYCFLTIAAFFTIGVIYQHLEDNKIKNLAGLGTNLPFMSVILVISMVGLIGLPPTFGFSAKFMVMQSVINLKDTVDSSWLWGALVAGIIATVISLFFYLKLPYMVYLQKNEKDITHVNVGLADKILVALTIVPVVVGFVFWGSIIDIIKLFISN